MQVTPSQVVDIAWTPIPLSQEPLQEETILQNTVNILMKTGSALQQNQIENICRLVAGVIAEQPLYIKKKTVIGIECSVIILPEEHTKTVFVSTRQRVSGFLDTQHFSYKLAVMLKFDQENRLLPRGVSQVIKMVAAGSDLSPQIEEVTRQVNLACVRIASNTRGKKLCIFQEKVGSDDENPESDWVIPKFQSIDSFPPYDGSHNSLSDSASKPSTARTSPAGRIKNNTCTIF